MIVRLNWVGLRSAVELAQTKQPAEFFTHWTCIFRRPYGSYEVCPEPISAVIRRSKLSLLMGISGVWNGFFMTASP
jgi:hypothetical protein